MKRTWLVVFVFVASGAVDAFADSGAATKDGEAPRATKKTAKAKGAGAEQARAAPEKKSGGGKGVKDGGALQASSLFGAQTSVPWRGSQIVYRNTVSPVSLNRSAELTYNPYYAMTWSFRPWWWFTKSFYLRARLDVDRELTQSDVTTDSGEALLGDLQLVAGLSGIVTIPKVKIDFSFDVTLTIPTSKASQYRTLALGIGPSIRMSRTFRVLQGLVLGYTVRVTPTLHRYTTSERETPLIPGCAGAEGCDSFSNTGRRNRQVRVTHYADISLRALKWLGISLAVGQAVDWLYPLGDSPEEVSLALEEPENKRYLTFFDIQLAFQPWKALEIALGYSALHPQRAPDSGYYVPFFNRYSVLYLDLKLKIDGLVAAIKRRVK